MSKCNVSITDAGEIPADILAKLEAAPDDKAALFAAKIPAIDAALRQYYPRKSVRAISEAFGVSAGAIQHRIRELGL